MRIQHLRIQPRALADRRAAPSSVARRAFTLVEMLVAVALVVLMMSLFAEVFAIATGTMTRQKGLAENDQRDRLLRTVLRNDLDRRTFTNMLPFGYGDVVGNNRHGYFYISENNRDDDTDDVLQFTITVPSTASQTQFPDKLYGRAVTLANGGYNQPDYDDGIPSNNSMSSPSAEVSYFLRQGRLYRRVLLLRQPANDAYQVRPQSNATPPVDLLTNPYSMASTNDSNATGNFWTDFDLSAYYDYNSNQVDFNGISTTGANGSALSNLWPQGLVASASFCNGSLGYPSLRFGHRWDTIGQPMQPVEYVNGTFIGRFTQEETSNQNFGFPGVGGVGGDNNLGTADDTNPYTNPNLTVNANGVVTNYAGGPRSGTDLLLSNVHAFDIKVWDARALFAGGYGPDGQPGIAGVDDDRDGTTDNASEAGWVGSDDGNWVDLGHNGPAGFYRAANNLGWGPDGLPGVAGVDDDGANGTDDQGETGWGGSDDYGNRFDTWHPGIQARTPYRAYIYGSSGVQQWQANQIYAVGSYVVKPGDISYAVLYRCISPGTSAAAAPSWNFAPGDTFTDGSTGLRWLAVNNIAPLTAIQIRIRFYDVSSAQMREVTLVHKLTN